MSETQAAANCRWGLPTLFLDTPDWANANDRPWSCLRDEAPVELESTACCRTCVRWESRPASAGASGEPSDQLPAQPLAFDILL